MNDLALVDVLQSEADLDEPVEDLPLTELFTLLLLLFYVVGQITNYV